MIMEKFNEEEQGIILEIARVALADADTYDDMADKLDLSDAFLKELQAKIRIVSIIRRIKEWKWEHQK